ncbi:MAG: molybdenum cofactor biosynthesis protein MoeB, partial [Bacteroidetes bacterium SW_11_45_7]
EQPDIIGRLPANEVIKVISGIGDPLIGKLYLFDALRFTSRTLKFSKDPRNPISGDNPSITELIDYEQFCGIPQHEEAQDQKDNGEMKEVTVNELKQMRENREDFELIDVREPFEYDIVNLEGKLIPQKEVTDHLNQIPKDKKVVVHCRSGGRSGDIVDKLEKDYGYDNLYNLKGGVLAWADEIDPSLPKY